MIDPDIREALEKAVKNQRSTVTVGPPKDPRILFQTEHYRVIAPQARETRSGLFINGPIMIEVPKKDALGVPVWVDSGLNLLDLAQTSTHWQLVYYLIASLAGGKDKNWTVTL